MLTHRGLSLIVAATLLVTGSFFTAAIVSVAHGASFPDQREQAASTIASTTAYGLSANSSTRLVATSSDNRRVALSIESDSCAAGGVTYLQFNDVAAAANTGNRLGAGTATSSETLGQDDPMVRGSIRALSTTACTILVTEWRLAQ